MQASRTRLIGGLVALALIGGGVATASLAQAEPPVGHGEGAVFERGECTFNVEGFFGSCTFREVITPSGNSLQKAQGTLAEGVTPPQRTVHVKGFECFSLLGFTTNSRATITPSGRVHITCVVRHPTPKGS